MIKAQGLPNHDCSYIEQLLVLFMIFSISAFDSSSGFHDAGKYPDNALITAATIPPYFAVNIIGAIGTFFDVPNWKQNFVNPETYIFKKVIAQQVAQPFVQNAQQPNQLQFQAPNLQNFSNQNLQTNQVLPNSSGSFLNLKFNEVKNEQGTNP